jgi:hypothetical protein
MTVTAKCLLESKIAENAQTTQYTAVGVRTIIDKLTGYNYTGGSVALSINLVAPAGAAGAANLCVVKTISAGETYTFPEIVGHVLNPGGFISTLAGAATSITIRISGREIS